MTVLDANVLLYAYNADAPQQPAVSRWLSQLMEKGEPVALPWLTIWAFLRISTNSRIWPNPLHPKQAFGILHEWLAQPGVIMVQPGPRHMELLERLIIKYSATGTLVTDVAMAALAMETGAVLASTDQDFRRFPELRWTDPLADDARAGSGHRR